MRQRKLGSHTPPCHRRMVITTLFSVLLAALQRRPVLYHTRWLLAVHWHCSSGHGGQLAPTTHPQCRLVSNPCPAGREVVSKAQWRLGWRKGVSEFQHVLHLSGNSTNHCCYACGAYRVCSPPCMRIPPTHSCLLAFVILTWAALSPPQSCFGCATRDNMLCLWLRGATAPCLFIS